VATRGIVLDLDETVLDRNATLLEYAARLYSEYGARVKIGQEEFISLLNLLDGKGRAPRKDFFKSLAEHAFHGISKNALEEHFYENAWIKPIVFPGVVNFLTQMRAHRLPIGIVTNGRSASQRAKLNNSGIVKLVDHFVISEEFGARKPEPEIFLHVSKKLGIEPKISWFIGDDPVSDIVGAKNVGFNTVWLERYLEWPASHITCFDLKATQINQINYETFIA
jgi:putative hydrolase of the HAD superfamily